MHIVFIRHGTRIDKSRPGTSPGESAPSVDTVPASSDVDMESSNWLSNFDPPLNEELASHEMDSAFKKVSTNIFNNRLKTEKIMIHTSPYNRCIQTSELLLDKIKRCKLIEKKAQVKLRVDQALSEWLNENYNLKYLPPNDDGYSMINNVNAYLNQPASDDACKGEFSSSTRTQLRAIKDFTWSYNQLGHCGDYGESASTFTRRCFNYLISLLQLYYTSQDSAADRHMVVFVISHGAVISTLLQILLGRSIFNEIPLCTPLYFKQSSKRRSVFKLMDYDFNLYNLLSPSSDNEFYKILDRPIDLTKLDPENLRSELTIGTTGYTTIIQSLPRSMSSPKPVALPMGRRRRNTINIGDKEKEGSEDQNIESLKHTRSSRQLYLLNKDTSEEKVIDLDKLHSYFAGDSTSDSDDSMYDNNDNIGGNHSDYGDDANRVVSINDFDDNGKSLKENVYKGSITSLSSFNEENKSKFQLNMKNFYSKSSPIEKDPYSHFLLRSDSMENDSGFDEFNMSYNTQNNSQSINNELGLGMKRSGTSRYQEHTPLKGVHIDIFEQSSDSDDDNTQSDTENDSDNAPTLSFGTKLKLEKMKQDNKNILQPSKGMNHLREDLFQKSFESLSVANRNVGNNSNVKLVLPKLISTRNMNLLVRGGGDESAGTSTETISALRDKGPKSTDALKRLLFSGSGNGLSTSFSTDEEGDDGDEWFGGFSR